jgi:predicted translin family RNA/ssDNA-binding protein
MIHNPKIRQKIDVFGIRVEKTVNASVFSTQNQIVNDLSRITNQNTQLISNEEFRKTEHSNALASLQQIQTQIQNDRNSEIELRHNEETEKLRNLKETWSNHEDLVKQQIKQICAKHTIEYVEKVPFKGSPDNTIKIVDEFVIFDAKSPGSDDLSNFPQYLKT